MRRIDRTYRYDVAEWTAWFDYHGFKIDEVEAVEIGTTVAAVYLFVCDEAGNRQRDPNNRDGVLMTRVTFDIRRPEPDATKRGEGNPTVKAHATAGF